MSIPNLFIALNKRLHRLLALLGLRKNWLYWGTVYDSVTKQPLDPAVVRLVSVETGEAVATCVTDMSGRYNFFASPGRYKIFVKRSNYQFPSQLVQGEEDGVFNNLYHGEFFDLNGDSDIVSFNIPLDPLQPDWNQQAKKGMMGFSPFLEHFLNLLVAVLFWFVLLLALFNFFSANSPASRIALALYGLVLLLAFFVPKPRIWGRIRRKAGGQPLLTGCVELSHREIPDIVVAKSQIFEDGKFFLRVEPGKYLLKVKGWQATDQEAKEAVLRTLNLRVGPDGLVNRNIAV